MTYSGNEFGQRHQIFVADFFITGQCHNITVCSTITLGVKNEILRLKASIQAAYTQHAIVQQTVVNLQSEDIVFMYLETNEMKRDVVSFSFFLALKLCTKILLKSSRDSHLYTHSFNGQQCCSDIIFFTEILHKLLLFC